MDKLFKYFEKIARNTIKYSSADSESNEIQHPFEYRNIHPSLPKIVCKLFDDGHYAQATFEAFKYIDKEVARLSKSKENGFKLMMIVFSESSPILKLTPCSTASETDEQKGFQFLFAGSVMAIRNPRGHEYDIRDSPDECLDHLALVSTLLRRLEAAGFSLSQP
jgi:uncharacterized protein (TIGR02391 family)